MKHKARQRRPETLERAYYEELGLLKGETPHVAQLIEALGPVPSASYTAAWALEIGCGASPYVPALVQAGYLYVGIDASPWAADWTHAAYGVTTHAVPFERFEGGDYLWRDGFCLILAAHIFEHLADAPGAIVKCADWLVSGGELWVVVPDDSDPLNVDHLWFFDLTTLRLCLESAGLVVERMAVRKYVPQERFLYARARKP